MSLHTTPHCSPHWPTLHVPVNEFNGLRSDLHELLPVMLGAGCSPWAHRGTTDTCCGFSSLKFTQQLTLRCLSLFFGLVSYFVLCFACLQQDSYSHRGIFLPDKRKKEKEKEKSEQFPTYIMKKSRQFAPHCSKLSKTQGTSNWFHEKGGLV